MLTGVKQRAIALFIISLLAPQTCARDRGEGRRVSAGGSTNGETAGHRGTGGIQVLGHSTAQSLRSSPVTSLAQHSWCLN